MTMVVNPVIPRALSSQLKLSFVKKDLSREDFATRPT
jgi:hypothetical protein